MTAPHPAVPASSAAQHARPVVRETLTTKSLQFSIGDVQSCMDLRYPDALTLDYTQLMMGFLLFQAQPRRIAMIGLGGGSLAKFCLRNLPTAHMTVVEINPHVLAIREAFCIPPDGDHFQVVLGDGADYVRHAPTPAPDVLLVDGYDVGGLPAALGSQGFYDDCFRWLERGALLVANLHMNAKAYPEFVARIQHSFQGNVRVVQEQYGANCIVFARKGDDDGWPTPPALPCPPGFDTFAWLDLQPALDHLRKVLATLQTPPAEPRRARLTAYFCCGDTLRSRSVGDTVLTGTLDVQEPPARLVADCEREVVRLGLEAGDVQALSLARARTRWPAYSRCVQAMSDWMQAIGLAELLTTSEVALMVCRGARYHHDAAHYGGTAFCNLFLSEDRGLDLHFPNTGHRIPLTRGTAVVFDTGQPHAVVLRNGSRFYAADFPPERDCTQLFFSWELPITTAAVARALQVTFDVDPTTALRLQEEQVWVDGAPATVCPLSGAIAATSETPAPP